MTLEVRNGNELWLLAGTKIPKYNNSPSEFPIFDSLITITEDYKICPPERSGTRWNFVLLDNAISNVGILSNPFAYVAEGKEITGNIKIEIGIFNWSGVSCLMFGFSENDTQNVLYKSEPYDYIVRYDNINISGYAKRGNNGLQLGDIILPTKTTLVCDDERYYINNPATLLEVNGRTYVKNNNIPAFMAYILLEGSAWGGGTTYYNISLLVSNSLEAVYQHCEQGGDFLYSKLEEFDYNGSHWYATSNDWGWEDSYTPTGGVTSNLKIGDEYKTLTDAGKDLLNLINGRVESDKPEREYPDTLIEKLEYLRDTKSDIKDAIIEKGGVVSDSTPLKDYAQVIRELPSGVDYNEIIKCPVVWNTTSNLDEAMRLFYHVDDYYPRWQFSGSYDGVFTFFYPVNVSITSYTTTVWYDESLSGRSIMSFDLFGYNTINDMIDNTNSTLISHYSTDNTTKGDKITTVVDNPQPFRFYAIRNTINNGDSYSSLGETSFTILEGNA